MESKKYFFKIIVPMYNAKDTILRLLQSIRNQTFQDYAVVVCDDCSTDGSLELVQNNYKDKNFHAFRLEKKRFAGGARNEGFRCPVDAEYTWFIDADDHLIDSNVLKDIHDFISNHDAKMYTVDSIPHKYDKTCMFAPWFKITKTEYTVDDFQEGIPVYDDIVQDFKQYQHIADDEILHIDRDCIFYTGSHHPYNSYSKMQMAIKEIPMNLTKQWQIDKKQNLMQQCLTFDKNT